jgi:nucleoside diphosphate kinase
MENPVTIALIKPDAWEHRKEILMKIIQNFVVVQAKDVEFTPKLVRAFYSEHVNKEYFPTLLGHMCSGRTLVLKLRSRSEGNTISMWREAIGPTNPTIAKQDGDSLRSKYGTDLPRNAFHGSDSWESTICEAAIFGM